MNFLRILILLIILFAGLKLSSQNASEDRSVNELIDILNSDALFKNEGIFFNSDKFLEVAESDGVLNGLGCVSAKVKHVFVQSALEQLRLEGVGTYDLFYLLDDQSQDSIPRITIGGICKLGSLQSIVQLDYFTLFLNKGSGNKWFIFDIYSHSQMARASQSIQSLYMFGQYSAKYLTFQEQIAMGDCYKKLEARVRQVDVDNAECIEYDMRMSRMMNTRIDPAQKAAWIQMMLPTDELSPSESVPNCNFIHVQAAALKGFSSVKDIEEEYLAVQPLQPTVFSAAMSSWRKIGDWQSIDKALPILHQKYNDGYLSVFDFYVALKKKDVFAQESALAQICKLPMLNDEIVYELLHYCAEFQQYGMYVSVMKKLAILDPERERSHRYQLKKSKNEVSESPEYKAYISR